MSLIRLPKGEPVSVSDREGAIIDEYFRLLNVNPFTFGYRKNQFFSIVVSGSSDVGKSPYLVETISQFQNHHMIPHNNTPTIGVTVRDSHAVLLVYDVSNNANFDYLSTFYDSLQSEVSNLPSPINSKSKKKPIFVVANKVDQPGTDRVVTQSEGEEFAARIGAKYLETSAKDNMGVTEAINMAITYGLIHCAEVALPDLRKAVAERNRSDGISDDIWETIVKCIREFAGKVFVKSRC